MVPSTHKDAFKLSPIETASLYVPSCAIDLYKSSLPWSSFSVVNPLYDEDTGLQQQINDEAKYHFGIYNLSGQRISKMQKGVNIITNVNGRNKKVLFK